jgi:hypothetical protein
MKGTATPEPFPLKSRYNRIHFNAIGQHYQVFNPVEVNTPEMVESNIGVVVGRLFS